MGRILVIRGGAVGDFILTLPAIRLLKESLPDNEVEILGYAPIISLAEAGGLAHRTRSIEHGALAGFFIPNGVLDPDWMEYFGSFDLIVSYLYDPDGHFHANLEKCEPGSVLACSHRISEPGDHAAVQLARPLEQIALYLEDPAPTLTFPEHRPSPDCELGDEKRVAIHPGSGGRHKIWPAAKWVELVRELQGRHRGYRIVLVTGEAEQDRGTTAEIVAELDGIDFDHLDSLPLPELASQLAGCELFVGHDSGISHLAAACGIPCVLLFGPTDPEVWAPRNAEVEVIRADDANLGSLPLASVSDTVHRKLG